jgi:hypothetical protein
MAALSAGYWQQKNFLIKAGKRHDQEAMIKRLIKIGASQAINTRICINKRITYSYFMGILYT